MPDRISAWAVYDVFTVKDGEQIFCAVSDAQWATFYDAFGLADLKADARWATNNSARSAAPRCCRCCANASPHIRQRSWRRSSKGVGPPFAPIRRPEDLFTAMEHLNATGVLPTSRCRTAIGLATAAPNHTAAVHDGRRAPWHSIDQTASGRTPPRELLAQRIHRLPSTFGRSGKPGVATNLCDERPEQTL